MPRFVHGGLLSFVGHVRPFLHAFSCLTTVSHLRQPPHLQLRRLFRRTAAAAVGKRLLPRLCKRVWMLLDPHPKTQLALVAAALRTLVRRDKLPVPVDDVPAQLVSAPPRARLDERRAHAKRKGAGARVVTRLAGGAQRHNR